MKAQIRVDENSGLMLSVIGTAANVANVTQVDTLLYGAESYACADTATAGWKARRHRQLRHVASVNAPEWHTF